MKSRNFLEALKKAKANAKRNTSKIYFDTQNGRLVEKQRAKPRNLEDKIQEECVDWVRDNRPDLIANKLFFHVPNGGKRDGATASKMQRLGVVAGVADLFLEVAAKGFCGLKIEMKTAKGRQSPHQKIYQKNVEEQGYKYVICRSCDEFVQIINWYLG